jgi:hypothetical protein
LACLTRFKDIQNIMRDDPSMTRYLKPFYLVFSSPTYRMAETVTGAYLTRTQGYSIFSWYISS